MGKRKKSTSTVENNGANGGRGETVTWSHAMDAALIDAYLLHNDLGNRVGGTFTTEAYDNILKELKEFFPEKPIDKERIKNRMKYIKRGFGTCYDIFRNGSSGFQWSPVTNMWSAEPEVWTKLIEAHPEAADWKDKPILHYDKLVKLYGQDRATGDHAETPAEMRQRMAGQTGEVEGETIAEIDRLVAQNEAMLGVEEEIINSPELRKRQKSKASREEVQAEMINGIEQVATAIMKSTEQLVKSIQRLPIPATQIWNHVVELNLDPVYKTKAYLFLTKNPDMVEAFLGCPLEERKELLMNIIPN